MSAFFFPLFFWTRIVVDESDFTAGELVTAGGVTIGGDTTVVGAGDLGGSGALAGATSVTGCSVGSSASVLDDAEDACSWELATARESAWSFVGFFCESVFSHHRAIAPALLTNASPAPAKISATRLELRWRLTVRDFAGVLAI